VAQKKFEDLEPGTYDRILANIDGRTFLHYALTCNGFWISRALPAYLDYNFRIYRKFPVHWRNQG